MNDIHAPLFRDPVYDGAADPTIIWNREEKSWWILYTNRRATAPGPGFSWVHGTDIGIASSADGGASWRYRGIVDGLPFERGLNTFWAPEVLFWHGKYHMFVSYVPGVPTDWSGSRTIIHYESANLWDWSLVAPLTLSSSRVIDACVFPLPAGGFRMWYKDEQNDSHSYAADSPDMRSWSVRGPVITDCPHEGPNVFAWKGTYWLIADMWAGQAVYKSEDLTAWHRIGLILDVPGTRPDDGWYGHHVDVLVNGDRAFVFYFTHPGRGPRDGTGPETTERYEWKRSSLQVAELGVRDGTLVCDRNTDGVLSLRAPGEDEELSR